MIEYRVYDDRGRCRAGSEGLGGIKSYAKALLRAGQTETVTFAVYEDGVERSLPVVAYSVLLDPDARSRRDDCDRVVADLDSARAYARYLLRGLAETVEIWEHDGERETYIWETLTRAELDWDPVKGHARSRLSPLAAR